MSYFLQLTLIHLQLDTKQIHTYFKFVFYIKILMFGLNYWFLKRKSLEIASRSICRSTTEPAVGVHSTATCLSIITIYQKPKPYWQTTTATYWAISKENEQRRKGQFKFLCNTLMRTKSAVWCVYYILHHLPSNMFLVFAFSSC